MGCVTRRVPLASAYGRPFERARVDQFSLTVGEGGNCRRTHSSSGRQGRIRSRLGQALRPGLQAGWQYGPRPAPIRVQGVRLSHDQRSASPRRVQGLVEVRPVAIPTAHALVHIEVRSDPQFRDRLTLRSQVTPCRDTTCVAAGGGMHRLGRRHSTDGGQWARFWPGALSG